jgi:MFS family permease
MNEKNNFANRTYFFDSLRLAFQGAIDATFISLALLVAIRIFDAPNSLKGVMTALTWLGGLLAPWMTRQASRTRWRSAHLGALLFLAVALCFTAAALTDSFLVYLTLIAAASIFYRSEGAFLIGIYANNYTPQQRASRIALGLMLSALIGVAFGHGSGILLNRDESLYRLLFFAAATCALLSGFFLLGIPTDPIRRIEGARGGYLSYLFRDKLFGKMTLYFTAVGFAYQMLIPMRIEHIANARYGMCLDNFSIMLLACVVPNVCRVLSTQCMGFLFDRVRFITTRLIVNFIFFVGVLFFFNSHDFLFLAIGSSLLGIAMAGSFVMHSLWLTKFVPEERLPAYTSAYLLTTGLRSVLSPLFGYALLSVSSPAFVGNFATLLIILASIGFWSLRRESCIR